MFKNLNFLIFMLKVNHFAHFVNFKKQDINNKM